MDARLKFLTVVVLVGVVGFAAAAITLTYTTNSTLSTSVTPVPVQFAAGDDAGPSALTNYVTAYAISTNKTYITASVKGVPEATVVVGSFFKLNNVDASNVHSVTLTTPQVSNANVGAYTIGIYNASGNALMATLTLTAGSPSASFSMGPSDTFYARLTLTLASGAGADNVALSNALTLSTL